MGLQWDYKAGATTCGLDAFGCHANSAHGGKAGQEFTVDNTTGQIQLSEADAAICVEAVPPQQAGLSVRHRAGPPPAVQLWNLKRPYLYTLVTTLTTKSGMVDSTNTTIGVRSALFSPNSVSSSTVSL